MVTLVTARTLARSEKSFEAERADGTKLRITTSDRVPGQVWLGVPSNLPAELSTFVGRAEHSNAACGCSANRGW